MKSFLINLLLFSLGLLVVFEIVLRVNHMTIDIPQREITSDGIKRYIPMQEGWWLGGTHKWQINQFGWPGPMPDSLDSLVLIIGDSHIENFMNNDNCHQSWLLKQLLPQFNFLEAARSGVSYIEAVYIATKLDTLRPILILLYVKDTDFIESITQFGRKTDITQIDLAKETLLMGEMRSPGLKKILYNVKVAYFTYSKLQICILKSRKKAKELHIATVDLTKKRLSSEEITLIEHLIEYSYRFYDTDKIVLLFHPGSDPRIVNIAERAGFKTVVFPKEQGKMWGISADDESHWTCEGHKEAAKIISKKIREILSTYRQNPYKELDTTCFVN